MKSLFNIVAALSAVLMIGAILMQSQGSSLGTAFGGESNAYRSKRGAEKLLYNATIILAVIFVLSLLLSLLSKS
ncbi:MAG TPA: preprotein translocase subunit SecG [Candidatus Saccharimonadales bacterium]|nr:preprotein translocase subunit SecG [Candidatus Saccharimonadales bacterium]